MDPRFVGLVDELENLREQAGRLKNRSLCTRTINSLIREYKNDYGWRGPKDSVELMDYIMGLNDSQLSQISGFGEGVIEMVNMLQGKITPEEVKASIGIISEHTPLRPYILVVKSTSLYGRNLMEAASWSSLHAFVSPYESVKETVDFFNSVRDSSLDVKYELVGIVRAECDVSTVDLGRL
jgi:hypothetical protein